MLLPWQLASSVSLPSLTNGRTALAYFRPSGFFTLSRPEQVWLFHLGQSFITRKMSGKAFARLAPEPWS